MIRAVTYCGTRNLYHDMTVAVKSLLYHHGADKIYFLIEDDTFPEPLPKQIECINVSGQQYFSPLSPNYNSPWTYMVLMRAALSKIFPEHDTMLSLDVDTFVCGDLSKLWKTDLTGAYFAAVPETTGASYPRTVPYYNFGVVLLNLAKLRERHYDEVVIRSLNIDRYRFPEQDAMNRYCHGHTVSLPDSYNRGFITIPFAKDQPELIRHYACDKNYRMTDIYKLYDAMTWEEAQHKPAGTKRKSRVPSKPPQI